MSARPKPPPPPPSNLRVVPKTQHLSFSELPKPQVYATLAAVMSAMLLAALDQTIVGTAMPRIIGELHGFEHYAWVTTAYLVTSTAGVPIFGKLSDLYGRKLFLLGGVAVFVGASALCGLAQSMTDLVIFRGIQGLGAGCTQAMAFTTIADLFPPAQRGKLAGVFGAVFGLSSVIGPTVGGFLTDGPGWRWVFLVNLPLGILSLILLTVLFPNIRRQHTHRPVVDIFGAVALVVGVVPLLLALSWGGRDYAWDSPMVIGLLVLAAFMTVAFIRVEVLATEPIIPLGLFRQPGVTVSIVAGAMSSVGMFGTVLFIPLFIQGVIGTTATQSGAVLTPMMLALIASSTIGGQIISRVGRYKWMAVVGVAITAVGTLLLAGMGTDTDYITVVRNMIVMGLGLGTTMPVFTLAVQNAVEQKMIGTATSTLQFFRSMGGALGAAIFGSVLANAFPAALRNALPADLAIPPDQLAQLSNPQALMNPEIGNSIQQISPVLIEVMRGALAASLHQVFLIAALIMVATTVLTMFLREAPLRGVAGKVELHEGTTEVAIS